MDYNLYSIYHTFDLVNLVLEHVMPHVQIIKVAALNSVPVLIERLLFNHPVLVLVVVECVLALTSIEGAGTASILCLRLGDVLGELKGTVSRGFLFLFEGGRGRNLCADTQQVLALAKGFGVVLSCLKLSSCLLPVFRPDVGAKTPHSKRLHGVLKLLIILDCVPSIILATL
jgi:hypothetical protein